MKKYEVSYLYSDADGDANHSPTAETVEADSPLEAIIQVFNFYRSKEKHPNLFSKLRALYPSYGTILSDDDEFGFYENIEVVEVTDELLLERRQALLDQINKLDANIKAISYRVRVNYRGVISYARPDNSIFGFAWLIGGCKGDTYPLEKAQDIEKAVHAYLGKGCLSSVRIVKVIKRRKGKPNAS